MNKSIFNLFFFQLQPFYAKTIIIFYGVRITTYITDYYKINEILVFNFNFYKQLGTEWKKMW